MSKKLLLVSGCYDGGLVGLECTLNCDLSLAQFQLLFKFLAHQGSVKAISAGHKILATGGTDETVCLYNIDKLVESGYLKLCKGTITAIVWQIEQLKTKNLLFSTDAGKIHVFRAHDLEEICELNAHKGQINDIAMHPEGKVIVSIGKDCKLKLWDLATNLCVYNTTLGNAPFAITFSKTGNNYAFISDRLCTISNVADQFKPITLPTTETLTCVTFIRDDTVLLGTRSGSVIAWDFLENNTHHNLVKQECRLKSIKVIHIDIHILVFTANSKGDIYCWKYLDSKLIQIGYFNTETRLITIKGETNDETITEPENVKRKHGWRVLREILASHTSRVTP